MAEHKLAELLLRRKELQDRISRMGGIREANVYEIITTRAKAHEGIADDITAKVPKLTLAQVMHEYDWHARQLRQVDAAIQRTNWTTEVEVDAEIMKDYVPPTEEK